MSRTPLGLFATPCGASTYTTSTLVASGLHVGHEKLFPGGTVCGFWAMGNQRLPKDLKRQADPYKGSWDVAGVLLRHPLKVAESLPGVTMYRHQFEWSHEDEVLHALRYWVNTFANARKFKETMDYQKWVEIHVDSRYEEDMRELCRYFGLALTWPKKGPNSRNRRYPRKTWRQWYMEDPEYAALGEQYVREYGLEEPT